jgi:hypothetical protein
LALSAITGRALPKATSLFNATAQIFSSIGVATLSTLFIERTTSSGQSIATAAMSHGQHVPANIRILAATQGTIDVFNYLVIATAVAIIPALLLPARSLRGEQREADREASEEAEEQGRQAMVAE